MSRVIIILIVSIFFACTSDNTEKSIDQIQAESTKEEENTLSGVDYSSDILDRTLLPIDMKVGLSSNMCTYKFGCLEETFYPLGWSSDGKRIAFITEPDNSAVGGYRFQMQVQDLTIDSIIWEWKYNDFDQEDWKEGEEASLTSIMSNYKTFFKDTLDAYDIMHIIQPSELLKFPMTFKDEDYIASIEYTKKNNDGYYGQLQSTHHVKVEKGQKAKVVSNYEFKTNERVVASEIKGAFLSPDKSRIAILKVNEVMGWEGPPNVLKAEILGCDLSRGFK